MRVAQMLSTALMLCALSVAPAFAAQKPVVVYFSGLCNAKVGQACSAQQQAAQSIAPKLPQDAVLIYAPVQQGRFQDATDITRVAAQIGNQPTVLVAYSAGYQGLLQLVQGMTPAQLKNVQSIVSLEANYNGLTAAINLVKAANPNVKVYQFGSSQFGTYHALLTGSPGVGDAIASITSAASNAQTVTGPIPTVAQPTPGVQTPAAPFTQPFTQTPGYTNTGYQPPFNAGSLLTQATAQDPFRFLQQFLQSPSSPLQQQSYTTPQPTYSNPSLQTPTVATQPVTQSYLPVNPSADTSVVAQITPTQPTTVTDTSGYQYLNATSAGTTSNISTITFGEQPAPQTGFQAPQPDTGTRWSLGERLSRILAALSLRMQALLQ